MYNITVSQGVYRELERTGFASIRVKLREGSLDWQRLQQLYGKQYGVYVWGRRAKDRSFVADASAGCVKDLVDSAIEVKSIVLYRK